VVRWNLALRSVPVAQKDPTVLVVLRVPVVPNRRMVLLDQVVLMDLVHPLIQVHHSDQYLLPGQVVHPHHLDLLVHFDPEDQMVLAVLYHQFHRMGLVDQQPIQAAPWVLKVQIHQKDLVVRVVQVVQMVLVVLKDPVDQFHPMVLHSQRLPVVLEVLQVLEDL
jgi:hypothetical protein